MWCHIKLSGSALTADSMSASTKAFRPEWRRARLHHNIMVVIWVIWLYMVCWGIVTNFNFVLFTWWLLWFDTVPHIGPLHMMSVTEPNWNWCDIFIYWSISWMCFSIVSVIFRMFHKCFRCVCRYNPSLGERMCEGREIGGSGSYAVVCQQEYENIWLRYPSKQRFSKDKRSGSEFHCITLLPRQITSTSNLPSKHRMSVASI